MKKLLILFITFCIIGCSNIQNKTEVDVVIDCPRVFFSSENNIFIDGNKEDLDLDLDKINYKAALNNYGFVDDCISSTDYKIFNLELLILVEPINPNKTIINMPIFALLYNSQNEIIDRQYFKVKSSLNYNSEISKYEITDVNTRINILVGSERKVDSITIGFVNIN